MKLKFFTYVISMPVAFLLLCNFASGQEKTSPKTSCESLIEIHGSSNVNQFQLINHNPKIIRHSQEDKGGRKPYQRIEIPVNEFKATNDRMRTDFLEMINASKYPFIIMAIEPRSLADCRKNKGLADFKTKITIAGVTQSYVVPCGVDTCESSGYVLKGNLEVKLSDFGIDPPVKFFGLVKVNNEVLINYIFRFRPDDPIFRPALTGKPTF